MPCTRQLQLFREKQEHQQAVDGETTTVTTTTVLGAPGLANEDSVGPAELELTEATGQTEEEQEQEQAGEAASLLAEFSSVVADTQQYIIHTDATSDNMQEAQVRILFFSFCTSPYSLTCQEWQLCLTMDNVRLTKNKFDY